MNYAIARGYPVELYTFEGERGRIQIDKGSRDLRPFLEALARVKAARTVATADYLEAATSMLPPPWQW